MVIGGDTARQPEYTHLARDRCFIGHTLAPEVAYEVGSVQVRGDGARAPTLAQTLPGPESEAGGGDSVRRRRRNTPEELEQEGTRDVGYAIDLARRCLDAGAYMIMIESEGITEEVTSWRTDVVARIARELGLEKVMFEAADPEVFGWYVKNYGSEVNLFADRSQIVQLECRRRGIWGTKSLWGRVVTYGGSSDNGTRS